MVGMYIIIPIVTFIIGGLLAWLGMRFLLKSKYDSVLQEAEKEAEVIKKNKMLEVKEKFLHLKADLEKQVSQRNAKIQSLRPRLPLASSPSLPPPRYEPDGYVRPVPIDARPNERSHGEPGRIRKER